MSDSQREQALDAALSQIERQYGKGTVMKMSDQAQVAIPSISTGSLSLDLALGVGGLPRGRIIEIFGPESSGKTTLVYHVIAEAQRRGGICAFIDAEHAMDPSYARRIGVNIDDLLVSQPDNGEQALEIAELLIRSGAVDVVAVDSVAALTPKAEIEGEMGDSHVGLQARLMSQALRKLAGTLNRTGTVALFTNQLREKIGVMFGNPETTPGGRALKFYSSIRLDIRRIETLKEGVEAIGNRVRVKVVKNKVAPPFKQAEFDIIYGDGISWEGSVLDVGLERKLVQKSGSYFSYGDERLGQGRQNATAFLREHPDVTEQHAARPLQARARARRGRLLAAPAGGRRRGKPRQRRTRTQRPKPHPSGAAAEVDRDRSRRSAGARPGRVGRRGRRTALARGPGRRRPAVRARVPALDARAAAPPPAPPGAPARRGAGDGGERHARPPRLSRRRLDATPAERGAAARGDRGRARRRLPARARRRRAAGPHAGGSARRARWGDSAIEARLVGEGLDVGARRSARSRSSARRRAGRAAAVAGRSRTARKCWTPPRAAGLRA